MTKNTLLNISIILCKVFKIGLVLMIIALTTFFVHFQIDKDFYEDKELKFTPKDFSYSTKWKTDKSKEYKDIFTIESVKTVSLYLNYLKFIAVLVLVFMAIKEFPNVMRSVKRVETFGVENVKSFRRIGVFLLLYSLLTSYISVSFFLGGYRGFGIYISSLILVLIAFIMAEIFKEGSLLKQENDLTI